MKSPIPEDLRGKTISNIIVVCVGIVVAVAMLHIGQLWRIAQTVVRTAMPLFIGFAIAFILLPVVNRLERFFAKVFFRRKPHPKLGRALAVTITYVLLLALLTGFFALLLPQVIQSLKSVVAIVSGAVPRSTQDLRDMLEDSTLLPRLGLEIDQVMALWEDVSKQISQRLSELNTYTTVLASNLLSIVRSIGSGVYRVLFHALVGIIASVCALLSEKNVNVLDISQTILQEYFTMIMLVDVSGATVPFARLKEILTEAGQERNLDIRIQREDIFNAMHRI